MLHLHHLQNSRSFRIVWLLEELGLDYQLTTHERNASFLAPKSLTEKSPMGKAPILEVDGKPMMESAHIMDYLMAKYDTEYRLHPKTNADDPTWLNYDFWLHFAESSAMPPLLIRMIFNKIVERSPFFVKPITKGIQTQIETSYLNQTIASSFHLMESHLQDNQWFAGKDFSAVDIQMHFVVAAAHARSPFNPSQYANLLNWLHRLESRPAFEQAVKRGGRLQF